MDVRLRKNWTWRKKLSTLLTITVLLSFIPFGTMEASPQPKSYNDLKIPDLFKSQKQNTLATATYNKVPFNAPASSERELKDKRTRYSKTYINSDGTTTVQTSEDSIYYFDGHAWLDINTNIRPDNTDTNYTHSMLANSFKVRLHNKGNNQSVKFSLKDQSVTYRAEKMNNVTGAVNGNTITYTNAWQSTDLLYQVQNDQLKMQIILQDNNAPLTFSFELQTKGVKHRVNVDGSIDFIDMNGQMVFRIPPLWVQDASSDLQRYDRLKVDVKQKGSKTSLVMTLNDKGLQYPIIIDPTTVYTGFGTNKIWDATDAALGHIIGRAEGTSWSVNTIQDSSGYLNFGPYDTSLSTGKWTATWSMKIDNNISDDHKIVRLEVFDADAKKIINYRDISRQQFIQANQFQDFNVEFQYINQNHKLEFRTYWYDSANVHLQKILTTQAASVPYMKSWNISTDPAIGHNIGRIDESGWSANTTQDIPGFLSFGPYESGLNTGVWTTTWTMKIDNNTADNLNVVRLEVFDAEDGSIVASKNISRQQFFAANHLQDFSLQFTNVIAGHRLEFRTYWYGSAYIQLNNLVTNNVKAIDSTKTWSMTDSAIGHNTGRTDGTGWSANTLQDKPNYLSFGPYQSGLNPGLWKTSWSMKIDNNYADNAKVVRLEVFDIDTNEILAYRDINRQQFNQSNQFQEFVIQFLHLNPSDRLEFRAFWYGNAYINLNGVSLKPIVSSDYSKTWNVVGPAIGHNNGRADGVGWSANGTQDSPGFLSFGPYETGLSAGEWTNTWTMKIDNNTADNTNVVRLEVFDTEDGSILASKDISRQQFMGANHFQDFSLQFTNVNPGHRLEFRTYWYGAAYIQLKNLVIQKVNLGKIAFKYDRSNRLDRIVFPNGDFIRYLYDKNGNLIKTVKSY